jgi:hypothetical protein
MSSLSKYGIFPRPNDANMKVTKMRLQKHQTKLCTEWEVASILCRPENKFILKNPIFIWSLQLKTIIKYSLNYDPITKKFCGSLHNTASIKSL